MCNTRNSYSIKYIASKDQKSFIKDLKPVYQAVSLSEAEMKLLELEEKWGKKYTLVIQSWQNNWEELTAYFQYDQSIRKIIYTTNAVEGFHREIRKVTKTKGAFPTDMSLLKLVYLASENIAKKWTEFNLHYPCIPFTVLTSNRSIYRLLKK